MAVLMTKILVIEDEELVRDNLVELLDDENFEVIAAENGSVGVELARQKLPDLIVCDVMMPGLDGRGVLKQLRSDPQTARIPFIFLTAKATNADLRAGMELGADDYLTKPYKGDELLRAIAARLEKQAAVVAHYTTALQQAAQQLHHLVHYDLLTNLPNRLLLRSQFEQVLNAPASPGNANRQLVPVLCLGLDRFHRLLDVLGMTCGDTLLLAVAQRLRDCLSERDPLSRLEDDRFAIVLAGADRRQQIIQVVQTLLDTIARPFAVEGRDLYLTASIGIACYPHNGKTIDLLLQAALQGMSQAKQQGGNQYQFYTATLHVGSLDRLTLETSLRSALERDEFEVYYQPQVKLADGQIVGAEALLRWQHPERGLIPPDKFLSVAEETGLIVPIGEWVLQTACRQFQVWQQLGYAQLRLAVNLSGRQFIQPSLRQLLIDISMEVGFDLRYLELELTESIVVQNPEFSLRTLSALKALGVRIALDDFGTGYSSLNYLKTFPFDSLKIDPCFIKDLTSDETNVVLTTAIIKMARQLNLKTIAEGVDAEAELDFLYQQACDEMQGYFFSPPVPAAVFKKMLISGKKLDSGSFTGRERWWKKYLKNSGLD